MRLESLGMSTREGFAPQDQLFFITSLNLEVKKDLVITKPRRIIDSIIIHPFSTLAKITDQIIHFSN